MQVEEFIEKLVQLYRKSPLNFGIVTNSHTLGRFKIIAEDILKGKPLTRFFKKKMAEAYLITEADSIVDNLVSELKELRMYGKEDIEKLKKIVGKYLTEEDIYKIYKEIKEAFERVSKE